MTEKKFETLDVLLRAKAFTELSDREKALVEGVLGEKAYSRYRELLLSTRAADVMPVRKEVRQALTEQYKAKNHSWLHAFAKAKVPVYAHVMVLAVLVPCLWFLMPPREVVVEKTHMVQAPPQVDTLLVHLPPDTVYIDKLVQVKVPVYITRAPAPTPEDPQASGSTLADQRDLRALLVSGR